MTNIGVDLRGRWNGFTSFLVWVTLVASLCGCGSETVQPGANNTASPVNSDKLLIVDCLLPGQVRKLGTVATYVAARQAIKTSAQDCEIRGGEYTAYDRSNYATALTVWLPLAEQGDKVAQTNVGEIFEKGLGITPDYVAAAQWYRKAAEQGYSRAQINLGFLYEKGLGVKQDPVKALNWYRKAAGVSATMSLESGEGESGTLRKQLEETRQQLEQARKDLQRLKKSSTDAPEGKHTQAEATKIKQLDATIKQLQGELKRREEAPGTAGMVGDVTGPSIQVVDPPIVVTRGTPSVRIRSGLAVREVVGRVVAPAGLISLSVNDHLERPDSNGLFHALIPVLGTNTPVSLVAVDRQGKRVAVDFTLVPEQSVAEVQSPVPSRSSGDFGTYHAVVIGNQQYAQLPSLETAVEDAKSVAEVLKNKYGFDVTLLLNVSRYQILSQLEKLRGTLTEHDNLLIYYAGHGELDRVNVRGHWLPIDAEAESRANWISNVSITDILNAMKAREVLVVADSCYSGAMTRSSLAEYEGDLADTARGAWLRSVSAARSRVFMSSGGLRPVLDSGGGNHSVFAKVFLDVLNTNQDIIEGQRIYKEVAARVVYAAVRLKFEQVPEYAPIRYAGHESGDFLFVPKVKR